MLVPITERTKIIPNRTVEGCRCPRCGAVTPISYVTRRVTTWVAFIIPAGVVNTPLLLCHACNAEFDVISDKNLAARLNTPLDVENEIRRIPAMKKAEAQSKVEVGFSDKKFWLTMLLLIPYPFGLAFFYKGDILKGILCPLSFALAVVLPPLLAVSLLVCLGLNLFLLIQLLTQNAKDKNGKYICSKRAKQNLINNSNMDV